MYWKCKKLALYSLQADAGSENEKAAWNSFDHDIDFHIAPNSFDFSILNASLCQNLILFSNLEQFLHLISGLFDGN